MSYGPGHTGANTSFDKIRQKRIERNFGGQDKIIKCQLPVQVEFPEGKTPMGPDGVTPLNISIQCRNEGHWNPEIIICPHDKKDSSGNGDPNFAKCLRIDLAVCDRHKGVVKIGDILQRYGWPRVKAVFEKAGMIIDDKDFIEMRWLMNLTLRGIL